ncbi:MAG: hypothetical protein Q9204_005055 [Flavoplaca sp. TL-2023a]
MYIPKLVRRRREVIEGDRMSWGKSGSISGRMPVSQPLAVDAADQEYLLAPTKLPRLPTRVIDVGALGGRSPRLLETNRQPAHYIALSHCWGSQISSHTNLRLWQSNIQDLLSEIPLGSISKTFQDAIEVVRKLKFRYLWIDALCIIQDSKSDWEDESARMNDVYECSHLTLVATSAVSSNEGFVERPRLPIVTLPYRDDDDPTIEGRFSISRSIYGRHPWDLVDETAWNTRGWTYQERLLSRRLLHFTSSVLFWECRSIDRSEVNARERKLHDRPRWILTHPGEDQPAVHQHDIYGKYDRWYLILYEFTARRFTYTSDLLPAISGLATIFQQSFAEEDDYIAGIWSHDFAQGLLWLVQDSSATSKAMLDYWAPSWSWASIMGKLYWPTRSVARHQRDDSTVDLVDNRLKLFHDNPMGTVLGGYIRIRGRLRQLSCVTRPVEWGAFSRFRYDLWCEGNTLVGNGQFDVDQDDSAEEIWLLQVKRQQDGDCFFPYHPTALMLERVPESWLKFVRLGCAVLDDEQLDFFDVCEPQDFELY